MITRRADGNAYLWASPSARYVACDEIVLAFSTRTDLVVRCTTFSGLAALFTARTRGILVGPGRDLPMGIEHGSAGQGHLDWTVVLDTD